ncbi:Cht7 [Cordylochernes scorpioides]|uniref:Cht7 n=1 Tax=Cordylochernes scorpioides TaxID=51811 RepID=A0ABY6K9M4_9ARAC|nr:Cht7 [Cordylochernes scorpioides]
MSSYISPKWLCYTAKKVSGGGGKKKLVCYYTNWSQYRPAVGQFTPEDIPPHLCTHVLFAFGWMKKHKVAAFEPTDETKQGKKGLYERVIDLKKKNPELKILLAVGGWSFGTQRFKEMAASRYNRQLFIFSALTYLRKRNFDGLDLDWEFPRGNDDKRNFVALLKELREAFEEESKETRKPKLLLTVAVSAGVEAVQTGYDVPAVSATTDLSSYTNRATESLYLVPPNEWWVGEEEVNIDSTTQHRLPHI